MVNKVVPMFSLVVDYNTCGGLHGGLGFTKLHRGHALWHKRQHHLYFIMCVFILINLCVHSGYKEDIL